MAKEIERKFLIVSDAWRAAADTGTALKQGYIVTMDDRSTRVRTFDGDRARLTIKIGKTALVRDEFEYDIPLEDAQQMFTQAVGIIVEKTRYRVPHAGFVWEVDVYEGALRGLVVAEVELSSQNDAPDVPAWIGREVTGERCYSNQQLALHGMPSPFAAPHVPQDA